MTMHAEREILETSRCSWSAVICCIRRASKNGNAEKIALRYKAMDMIHMIVIVMHAKMYLTLAK